MNIKSVFFLLNMYKAFGLQNTNVIYNLLFTILLKSVDISVVPKEAQSSDQQQSREKCQTPAIPHPKRSPGQPRPRDRDRSNQPRHTNPSAALMHLPTSSTPKPKPAKAPPRTGEPRSNESPPLCHRSNASRPLQGHPEHQSSP